MACASYGVGGKNFTANFDGGYSPTDGTNTPQGGAAVSAAPTKLLLTPQNARNTRNLLLRRVSHGWHGSAQMFGCFQGGALVSSAPTEQEVHQPSKIDILPQISLCTDVRLRRI